MGGFSKVTAPTTNVHLIYESATGGNWILGEDNRWPGDAEAATESGLILGVSFSENAKLGVEVIGREVPVNISRVRRTSFGMISMGNPSYLFAVGEGLSA